MTSAWESLTVPAVRETSASAADLASQAVGDFQHFVGADNWIYEELRTR
jgi:hypothetical protein